MKKILVFLLELAIAFALIACLSGCDKSENTTNNTSTNFEVNRASTSIENSTIDDNSNPVEKPNNEEQNPPNAVEQPENTVPEETVKQPENTVPKENVVSEFTTQIKTKSKNRATNIQLTCEKLNGTIIKPGEEFSFCNKIGISKESEGYKKADVIINKKIVQALGGGNCQVSTTLFNAVLAVPNLEVTERHPHGKAVNYVPEGKDAAVAHGSKDFKFRNNFGTDLKVYASSDGKQVYVKLATVEQ